MNEQFNFGKALELLKSGSALARGGWNGKGMFIYLVPADTYPSQTNVAKIRIGETVDYGAYIAIKTTQGNVVPWAPSCNDALAEDWELI